MIKVLDCTLRDGGYIVDWMFGENCIQSVTDNLSRAKIDFIECGFLKECEYNPNKTFFDSPERVVLKSGRASLMVNYGEYALENFPSAYENSPIIRVAFKKHLKKEALEYINALKIKGWNVFANPMSTNTYSREELAELISDLNKIKPYGISIVDTLGNMYEKDVVEIFRFIDERLEKDISIGFHSHNSMQLSFSNTKALLKSGIEREIIIDSCVYGMGRGAGNLCTELITKYLNDNYGKSYKIPPILKIITENLKPIYDQKPWGYSTPYYIAAIHGCHPNYANYLVNQGFTDEKIDEIMNLIPKEKKTSFDKEFLLLLVSQLAVHS